VAVKALNCLDRVIDLNSLIVDSSKLWTRRLVRTASSLPREAVMMRPLRLVRKVQFSGQCRRLLA